MTDENVIALRGAGEEIDRLRDERKKLVAALKKLHQAYIYDDGIPGEPYFKIRDLPRSEETWAMWDEAESLLRSMKEL